MLGKFVDLLPGKAGSSGEFGGPYGGGGAGAAPAGGSPLIVGGRKKPFEFVVYFLWQEPSATETPAVDAAPPAGK